MIYLDARDNNITKVDDSLQSLIEENNVENILPVIKFVTPINLREALVVLFVTNIVQVEIIKMILVTMIAILKYVIMTEDCMDKNSISKLT